MDVLPRQLAIRLNRKEREREHEKSEGEERGEEVTSNKRETMEAAKADDAYGIHSSHIERHNATLNTLTLSPSHTNSISSLLFAIILVIKAPEGMRRVFYHTADSQSCISEINQPNEKEFSHKKERKRKREREKGRERESMEKPPMEERQRNSHIWEKKESHQFS